MTNKTFSFFCFKHNEAYEQHHSCQKCVEEDLKEMARKRCHWRPQEYCAKHDIHYRKENGCRECAIAQFNADKLRGLDHGPLRCIGTGLDVKELQKAQSFYSDQIAKMSCISDVDWPDYNYGPEYSYFNTVRDAMAKWDDNKAALDRYSNCVKIKGDEQMETPLTRQERAIVEWLRRCNYEYGDLIVCRISSGDEYVLGVGDQFFWGPDARVAKAKTIVERNLAPCRVLNGSTYDAKGSYFLPPKSVKRLIEDAVSEWAGSPANGSTLNSLSVLADKLIKIMDD